MLGSCIRLCLCLFLWKEKERSTIRAVQMDKIRGLLGIRRMDTVSNAQIKECCGVVKRVDERIEEVVFCWFSYMERMEKNKIAKRVL